MAEQLCVNCGKRRVGCGESRSGKAMAKLSICSSCYKIPGVQSRRRKELGLRTRGGSKGPPPLRPLGQRGRRPGEGRNPFRMLDKALYDLNDTGLKMEEAASGWAVEAGELLERIRRWTHEIEQRMASARASASRAEKLIREANAEARRRTKEIASLRNAGGRLKKSLPAVSHDHAEGPRAGQGMQVKKQGGKETA